MKTESTFCSVKTPRDGHYVVARRRRNLVRQHYHGFVAALFTAPFLAEDDLLANLVNYWPGDARQTLLALTEAGFIEVAPTGRYRLPLNQWLPAAPVQKSATPARKQITPLPTSQATISTSDPVFISRPASELPAPVEPTPVAPIKTPLGLPPLRLQRPTVCVRAA